VNIKICTRWTYRQWWHITRPKSVNGARSVAKTVITGITYWGTLCVTPALKYATLMHNRVLRTATERMLTLHRYTQPLWEHHALLDSQISECTVPNVYTLLYLITSH